VSQSPSYLRYINTNIADVSHKEPFTLTHNCMIYVMEGYGILRLQDRLFPLTAGQTFFIPRGCPAAYWSESADGWKYVWLNFEEWELFSEILKKTAFSLTTPICETTPEQKEYFERIVAQKWKLRNGNRYQTIGLTVELLSSYIETFPSQVQLREDASFQSLLTFINVNLCRTDLNMDMLVAASGYSRSTLFERFKKEVGCSPGDYIRSQRLNKARHMIYSTDLPVKQVAAAVGYEDPSYFARLFRNLTGDSPTTHRRGCRKHDPSAKK